MSSSPRSDRPSTSEFPPCRNFPCTTARSCCASTTAHRRRRTGCFASGNMASVMCLLAVLSLLLSPVSAVLISTFDNCLPDTTTEDPYHLQFHPILVAAAFGRSYRIRRQLEITVWGTVTGESTSNPGQRRDLRAVDPQPRELVKRVKFEPSSGVRGGLDRREYINGTELDSPLWAPPTYWDDYSIGDRWPAESLPHNASIVDQDSGWGQNVATTLITTASGVISNIATRQKTYFCSNTTNTEGLNSHGDCPMGYHELGNDDNLKNITWLTENLSHFTWNHTLSESFQFSSIGVTMKIVTGDKAASVVGCVNVEVTPVLVRSITDAVAWSMAGVLLLVALATMVTSVSNPWTGTTDIYKWTSNFGMDQDVIRLLTPGFGDCLNWLQFIVLTGSLSLNYPGYYQPVVANIGWSALLINTSFWSHYPVGADKWKADGLYASEAWRYGYERLAQSVGLLNRGDIWTSVMIWFVVILFGSVFVFQVYSWGRLGIVKCLNIEEQDLTDRNIPFTLGLMIRITYTYFLVPVLAASFFQLTVTTNALKGISAAAGITIALLLAFAGLIIYLILQINPPDLKDQLTFMIKYGTFYNTYSESQEKFFIVQLLVNGLRGLAFGAVQPSGIAQIVILAVAEIISILAIWATLPHTKGSSMNLWQIIFGFIRLTTILLMMAFIPSIGANNVVRGWVGYVIFIIHGIVLLFLFALKSLQTFVELWIRASRADNVTTHRGGLTKVFGARQLARRKRSSKSTVRSSSTTMAMTPSGDRKRTLTPSVARRPHSRSNSSAVLLGSPMTPEAMVLMHPEGSQSGHNHSNSGSTRAGYTPTTGGSAYGTLAIDTATDAGPYYRPPRTRGMTRESMGGSEGYSPAAPSRGSWNSDILAAGGAPGARGSRGSLTASQLMNEVEYPDSPPTPTAAAAPSGHRHTESGDLGNTDYAVREVDFYYGVRGPALSSQPGRRLGTGPADPTGPVSVAKSWLKQKLGLAKGKEERGFSVVRSSRAPEALMDAQRDVEALEGIDSPEAGEIGMAVTSPDFPPPRDRRGSNPESDSECSLSSEEEDDDAGPSDRMLEKRSGEPESPQSPPSDIELQRRLSRKPTVPRKSSKRKSREGMLSPGTLDGLYDPPIPKSSTSRLPFEGENKEHKRDGSGRSLSTTSSLLNPPEIADAGRPASVGEVQRHRVGEAVRSADERGEFRGSQAELVRERSGGSRGSRGSRKSWR